ncbi:MAG: hypothetical protein U0X71_05805 [Sphingobacteriaceae bacterium]
MRLVTVFEGDNIGSVARLEIAYHTDFESWDPATFKSGKSWQSIEITGETAELKRKAKDDPNGIVYTYSGFFDVHAIRDEVELNLMPYVGKRAVLRLTDSNGRVYIIGKPQNPIALEEESTTGKLFKNKNGYQFNFLVSQTSPAAAV